ncbi:MAG: sensor histidine kinase [Vicinamibacterales bacterium]
MRSLTSRVFVGLVAVAVLALALGAWLVRWTVDRQFNTEVVVEQWVRVVDGREIVEETRRGVTGEPVTTPTGGAAVVDVTGLTRRLVIAFAVVVVGAAIVAAVLARRVLGPIQALHAAAQRVSRGDPGRVEIRGHDELASLGRAFNEMAEALARQEQRKRDLTNDIAHELRTPLTDLRCHLEALQDGVVDITPETLATLHAEVTHLQSLVEDLGDLARAEARQLTLAPEAVDVRALLVRVHRQAAPRATALQIALDDISAPAGVMAWVDPGRLRQVVTNLLDNALVHTPAGGRIHLGASAADRQVTITVRDTGAGIPPDHLPHVFDRFYRVDPSRSRTTGGVGLGLAIARQLVEASGGRITAASEPSRGTTFTVTLPDASS